ncbi:hypothetical protein J2S55_001615 [Streptosporangium brasiliense]|uniref:Uncharacterized protein n=1 Tax=Streptosporangium brasiliense TaxID=47480 RepID=A0ABT9R0A8_9ACTN|nr:hypothetical protein [Streptosporangium brasiliense]
MRAVTPAATATVRRQAEESDMGVLHFGFRFRDLPDTPDVRGLRPARTCGGRRA